MKPNYIFVIDLAREFGIDHSGLLRKAKRETKVIQRARITNGGYKLVSSVPAEYAHQLRTFRKQADRAN